MLAQKSPVQTFLCVEFIHKQITDAINAWQTFYKNPRLCNLSEQRSLWTRVAFTPTDITTFCCIYLYLI
jgi:hypothetical protein